MTESNLVRRLENLEQENRRLKRWGMIGAGVMSAALLTSAAYGVTVCKTVWAERFVLKDSSNRDVLKLDAYTGGDPVITAYDDGKAFAKLTLSGKKPTLELLKDGKCHTKIGVENGETFVETEGADSVAMR